MSLAIKPEAHPKISSSPLPPVFKRQESIIRDEEGLEGESGIIKAETTTKQTASHRKEKEVLPSGLVTVLETQSDIPNLELVTVVLPPSTAPQSGSPPKSKNHLQKGMSIDQMPDTPIHSARRSSFQTYAYCIFAGLLSQAMYYIMLAESDLFSGLYPFGHYGVAVVLPLYVALPFSLVLNRVLTDYDLQSKIQGLIVLSNTLFLLIPYIVYFLPKNMTNYLIIIAIYTISYTLTITLQGYLVASCSNFEPKMTVLFQIFQPIMNILVTSFKLVLMRIEVDPQISMVVIWVLFTVCNILTIIFLRLVQEEEGHSSSKDLRTETTRGQESSENGSRSEPSQTQKTKKKVKKGGFRDAYRTVWQESLFTYLSYFVTFLTFPNLFFNIQVPSSIGKGLYLNMVTFCGAMAALLGKPTSFLECNRIYTRILLFLGVIVDILVVFLYWTDAILINQHLVWVFVLSAAFMIYRISAESTYNIYRSRLMSSSKNQEEIGSIMAYSIILGIATGNIGSEVLIRTVNYAKYG